MTRRRYTLILTPDARADTAALKTAFARFGAPFEVFEARSVAARTVYEGYRLILVRPDLHVVWRGHDEIPEPDQLAALATGHSQTAR